MTRFATSNGTTVAYETVGAGPDVVFLHAGIANRAMWKPQLAAFSDRYRCTAMDNRGFGESPLGTGPFSRRDDLRAVLDDLGADFATLVGCSIGAGFALDFAIEEPGRVDKLVLVGVTPAGFDGAADPLLAESWPLIDADIERGDLVEAGRMEARIWVDGPRRPEGSAPQWLRDQVVEWSLAINSVTDWGDSIQLDPQAMYRLHEVEVPTLVLVGAEDPQLILDGCRATAAGIAGAQLVELAGAAHLPNLEVPDAFNAAVASFLDG